MSQKDSMLDKQSKFISSIKEAVLREIKRRLQVLKLSNQERLLTRIGIKSAQKGKFDTEVEADAEKKQKNRVDFVHKLEEILEISDVCTLILEYHLPSSQEADSKSKSSLELTRHLVQYVFDNIEKPLIIPTENYIQQQLSQLQDYDLNVLNAGSIEN